MTKPIYPENRLPDEWQIENAGPKVILRPALYNIDLENLLVEHYLPIWNSIRFTLQKSFLEYIIPTLDFLIALNYHSLQGDLP